MRTIAEYAMPEESVMSTSAADLSKWLNTALEQIEKPEGAVLRIVHGDATTYLRLEV
jgi:hypothetical protein